MALNNNKNYNHASGYATTRSNSQASTLSGTESTISSSSPTLLLDNLRTHHTQALVNVVSSTLYPTPVDVAALMAALTELRRHFESPLSYINAHPAAKTNAIEVLEHILICWVCARASQADAQNYSLESFVATADGRFDKYAVIPVDAAAETVQCISYLATMSVGIAAVARTSIPASLVLAISFADDRKTQTAIFRTLTKLCTKHSVRRVKAGGQWESDAGIYGVMDAFSRTKTALRLRNRFDALGNAAFTFVSDIASTGQSPARLPTPPLSESSHNTGCSESQSCFTPTDSSHQLSDRAATSALAFVNAVVDAHSTVEARLRVRKELLDTPLYQCFKLLEEPELAMTRAYQETRRFRRAYGNDIKTCNPQVPSDYEKAASC
ncbi:hypothetical protein BX070DRAFT_252402 [Coemansia spiralis]|nr:hypothetical protein BX070DRAFT_252402 [Coemansia spiralis]